MRNPNIKSTHLRAIISGNTLEVYSYEKPIFYDFSNESQPASASPDIEGNRKRSRHRARKMVQRLVDANFGFHIDPFGRPYISKFLTLTFKKNIKTPKEANAYFTRFMKKLNYQVFKSKKSVIKYLAVVEFQKRGAVHYHVVFFNLPFLDNFYYFFKKLWGRDIISD